MRHVEKKHGAGSSCPFPPVERPGLGDCLPVSFQAAGRWEQVDCIFAGEAGKPEQENQAPALAAVDSPREPRSLAVYVHIPFCRQKCHYCDFYSLPLKGQNTRLYAETVLLELRQYLRYFRWLEGGIPRLASLYIGGGTPTCLPKECLLKLIRACRAAFGVQPDLEITVEANPGTVNRELLVALKAEGVNRLSLGVQTMDERLLKRLGRQHKAAEAGLAVETARQAGFANLSLDVMYGLPGQTLALWQDTVEKVLAFDPEHLSAYSLKVEPGTPFFHLEQTGELERPDEDLEARMFEWLRKRLREAGYIHYEISNFAKPGCMAQHNLAYWQNQEYLGLGPAAYSGLRGINPAEVWGNLPPVRPDAARLLYRFGNRPDLPDYLSSVANLDSPIGFTEQVSPALEKAETMFLGLRLLQEGVSKAAFAERFGETVGQAFPGVIDKLRQKGLLLEKEDGLVLSDRAVLLANQVFLEFLP